MNFQTLTLVTGYVIVVFAASIALIILWQIWTGRVSLNKLLSEPNGDASLSRLQLLIFTFVIALSFFLITVGGSEKPAFPNPIPAEVLTLLGISASSYLVSKGIQFSNPAGIGTPALQINPSEANVGALPADGGPAKMKFTASLTNAAPDADLPPLTWSLDAPSAGSLEIMPPNEASYIPDPQVAPGTVAKIRVIAQGYADGIAIVRYP